MTRRRTNRAAGFALAVFGATGCGTGADEATSGAPIDSLAVAESDSVLDDAMFDDDVFDDDPVPLLPGEGEPRDYRLLLVNLLEAEAFVFASAGAARVALDTVPAADSVLVDIRLRADHVLLQAEDPEGVLVDSASIDLVGTRLNRWEITSPARRRVAVGDVAGVLVVSEAGEYPRSR